MLFIACTQWREARVQISFAILKEEKRKMKTKQTIAIIGASGNMGSAISKSISGGNYRLLLLADKEEGKVRNLISSIQDINPSADVEAIKCSREASWEADIIISAVPYSAEKEVAEKIKEVANQKIVISITNPLNKTFDGLETSPYTSAAEELQKLLPNSKIIKAFNTTFAHDFSTGQTDGRQLDSFIAGNDEEALQTVSELVSTAGFNPVIAGDLSVSRTLESLLLQNISHN